MDLNEILVFTRVVQTGGFTAASRALGMPKSSVSKKVADLEARLGVRLLQRTTRKLGLTEAGKGYFQRSARIVADLEEAEQAVTDSQAVPRGPLRVTAPLSFGMLGPALATFLNEYPDVQLELVCTDRVVDLVQEGFDLALRAGPLRDSTLVGRKLGSIRRILVASPAYLRRHDPPKSPESLEKHACIVFGAEGTPNLGTLESGDQRKEVRVTPRFTVNDFDLMLDAARGGAGITLTLELLAAEDLRVGRLKRVLPGWCSPGAPVHAVYPSARHLSPKVTAFVEVMRRRFGQLEKKG